MSVLVRPIDVPVGRWPWIPLLSGLAVAAAVRQVAEVPAMLKWPNDIIVEDRKLGGLLVERIDGGDVAGRAAAVIGIGLNVTTTRDELPTPQATSLALESATTTDRNTLVKAVLRRLEGLLGEWEAGAGWPAAGYRPHTSRPAPRSVRSCGWSCPDQEAVEGVATGLDETGRLLVNTDSGVRAFGAGDVMHVRRPA